MAIDSFGVRAKREKRAKDRSWLRWLAVGVLLSIVVAAPLGYEWNYGTLGLIGPSPTVEPNGPSRIIHVPAGGNLQAAIARAESGDIVELQAGATYNGTITLPNKSLNDFVTIRTSGFAALAADKRVSPAQATSMAKIVAGMLGRPAVRAAKGANHYRFVGIEFTTTSTMFNYGLVELGRGEAAADLPHDIEIDRCYIHSNPKGVARRGIAVNSADTVIKNSYIEGFGFADQETQGIAGWTGTRRVKILNNYIEGGAENILFGGADPASADLIPTDIEIRGNYINKPAAWVRGVQIKTLFELKNAKKVQFIGNLLTNNYVEEAMRITIRNQDGGAPFSTIEDVLIKDNVIEHAGAGINILGKDSDQPSQVLKRLTIENNLVLDLKQGGNFAGSGYFIQINDGEDITIANNTVFNSGNITTLYGVVPRRFVFRDNIVGHGNYGIHGPIDLKTEASRAMFRGNIIMNLNATPKDAYAFPDGNTIVGLAEVGFAAPDQKDYRLLPASKFKTKGANLAPENYPR